MFTPRDHVRRQSSLTGATRTTLLAGVQFVEGVATDWDCWELTGWFEDHLVKPGYCERVPSFVFEPPVGSIAIDPRWSELRPRGVTGIERLPEVMKAARERVVASLRRFLPPERDDAVILSALFAKRVVRARVGKIAEWRPSISPTDRLSDVVLALFAGDMLTYREFHEAGLNVCGACGRVSFDPGIGRTSCLEHPEGDRHR